MKRTLKMKTITLKIAVIIGWFLWWWCFLWFCKWLEFLGLVPSWVYLSSHCLSAFPMPSIASLRNFPCESDFHSVWHVRALGRHLVIGSGLTKMVSYQCHGWVWDDKSIMEYKSQNVYFGIAIHNGKACACIAFGKLGERCCLGQESILVCQWEWEEYTRRSKTSRQSSQLAVDQHYTGPPPPFTRWKQETRDLERIGWKTNISGVDHEQQVTWARNWTGVALFWQLVFGCCHFLSSEDFSSKRPIWPTSLH